MPQSPEPQGVPESIVFGRFSGYKNTIDRERLGARDLAVAVNIDLDDDDQAHRRRGRTQVASGNYHSLWNADDGTVYGVLNGNLGIVRPDYSFVSRVSGVGGDYSAGDPSVAYCQIGDSIYFSAVNANGVLSHSTGRLSPWGPSQDYWLSPVVNPSATLPAIRGKLLGSPPVAQFLTYYNGRIYLAAGDTLWATEPWLYNYVDKTRNFNQFEGDITGLGTVADGVYVGTTEGLWFLGGRAYPLERSRVMDSPVIPGTMVSIPAELANPPQVGTDAVTPMSVSLSFMTTRGFCVAEEGGHALNLTEARVFFPVAQRGVAMFRRQDGMNHYVACLDSEGGPTNGARFGDFVDAEIIRGNVQWVDVAESAAFMDVAP